MEWISIVILAGVATWIFFAVRYVLRTKKNGGCVGCGTTGSCSKCNHRSTIEITDKSQL